MDFAAGGRGRRAAVFSDASYELTGMVSLVLPLRSKLKNVGIDVLQV
jgi:hypothetical protein